MNLLATNMDFQMTQAPDVLCVNPGFDPRFHVKEGELDVNFAPAQVHIIVFNHTR